MTIVPVYVFLITILAVDFLYTVIFWLIGLRPHHVRRYFALLALLGTEASLISILVMFIQRS